MESLYLVAGNIQPWLLFLSRLLIGAVFIYFGLPKIKDLKKNGIDFTKMGFKPGIFWGTIVAFLEFFGGILLILGIGTVILASLFSIMMLVGTIWKIKKRKKFSDWSYDLFIFILCLTIIFFRYSI